VLDGERKLLGFVSLRDLILAKPTALVAREASPLPMRPAQRRCREARSAS
jgi:Mg/Co/Ni transporter MgtE